MVKIEKGVPFPKENTLQYFDPPFHKMKLGDVIMFEVPEHMNIDEFRRNIIRPRNKIKRENKNKVPLKNMRIKSFISGRHVIFLKL